MRQLQKNFPRFQKFLHRLIVPLLLFVLVNSLIALPAQATGVYDIPSVSAGSTTWVIDEADVVSRANQGRLSGSLKKLAQETGQELRIVTFRRLDYGETINSFANQLLESWFPTPEEQANQALLVIDTLTDQAAISAGSEASALLSEEIAQSVTDETIGFTLREGSKYNEALLGASDRLVAVLSGEADPGPPVLTDTLNIEATYTSAEETDDRSATVWVIVLLIVATVVPMVTYFWYVGFPGS